MFGPNFEFACIITVKNTHYRLISVLAFFSHHTQPLRPSISSKKNPHPNVFLGRACHQPITHFNFAEYMFVCIINSDRYEYDSLLCSARTPLVTALQTQSRKVPSCWFIYEKLNTALKAHHCSALLTFPGILMKESGLSGDQLGVQKYYFQLLLGGLYSKSNSERNALQAKSFTMSIWQQPKQSYVWRPWVCP